MEAGSGSIVLSSDNLNIDEIYPFGRADGSKEDFDKFIPFTNQMAWGGLALRKDDISVPAIIGRKGSGKTYYLRRIEDHGIQRDDIYVVRSNSKAPDPELIRRLGSELDPNDGSSVWQLFWRRAIIFSLTSLFLCTRPSGEQSRFLGNVKISREEFYRRYSDIFDEDEFLTSIEIFTAANNILNRFANRDDLLEYLKLKWWSNLEGELGLALERCPPICYYLDHFDDDLRQGPGLFIDCQKGLYYTIQDLKKSDYFANRLHITTTMRDIVWAAVMESEHLTKQLDQYRAILHWSPAAARTYFGRKVALLPSQFAIMNNHDEVRSLESWLGFSEVENVDFGVTEEVFSYILRHTHNVPRELNLVGHRICMQIALVKEFGAPLSAREFREQVNYISGKFGAELLKVTQHYIASSAYSTRYVHEIYHGHTESNFHISAHVEKVLDAFLTDLGKDVFSFSELQTSLDRYQNEIAEEGDSAKYAQYKIENALWLQGLLGYRTYSEQNKLSEDIFHSNGNFDQLFIPRNQDHYVLHPSLKGNIKLKKAGERPIGGKWNHS